MDNETLEDYFRRSGDEELLKGEILEIKDKGFLIYKINKDIFHILHVYGDGRFWDKVAVKLARNAGLHKIRYATRRNPEAFIRRFKGKIIAVLIEREV